MSTPNHDAESDAAVSARLQRYRASIPPLDSSLHKGQAGHIAIIGGSAEYVGAPFFAASAAFRAGSDLVSIFAAEEAAPSLKTLLPDAVVHFGIPTLVNPSALKRAHAVVLGPGLGRASTAFEVVSATTDVMVKKTFTNVPLVIDADALWVLANSERYREVPGPVILTANAVELRRLCDSKNANDAGEFIRKLIEHRENARATPSSQDNQDVEDLAHEWGKHLVVVAKGAADVVWTRTGPAAKVRCRSARKRCGGQGDVLAGVMGLFTAWAARRGGEEVTTAERAEQVVDAAVAACVVTREASARAFDRLGRGMMASDVLPLVPEVVAELEDGSLDAFETTNEYKDR